MLPQIFRSIPVTVRWDSRGILLPRGAIITDYTVNYRQSGTSTWRAFPHYPSVVNEQMVTGLTNGTSYDFEVIPVSAIGNGTASNIVTATPTATPPAITVSVAPIATSTLPGTNITFTAAVTNALKSFCHLECASWHDTPEASILPHRIRAAARSPIRSRRPQFKIPQNLQPQPLPSHPVWSVGGH